MIKLHRKCLYSSRPPEFYLQLNPNKTTRLANTLVPENDLGCFRLSRSRFPRHNDGLIGCLPPGAQPHLVICKLRVRRTHTCQGQNNKTTKRHKSRRGGGGVLMLLMFCMPQLVDRSPLDKKHESLHVNRTVSAMEISQGSGCVHHAQEMPRFQGFHA